MTTVRITDVYLRDGLQDEDVLVSPANRIRVGRSLVDAGVPVIEVGSFVSDARVPQMAGAAEVLSALSPDLRSSYTVLALNRKGVERAAEASAANVSLAVSASSTHSYENAGRSTGEALRGLAPVVADFERISFSATVATAFTCPYEGVIPLGGLVRVIESLLDMGIETVNLADTLGNAPTAQVLSTIAHLGTEFPGLNVGLHLHDGLGQALRTAVGAAELGVVRFDASLAGFGGCPFAPGAAGNIATESLVPALHGAGHATGIDEERLAKAVKQARQAVAAGTPVPPAAG